MKLRKFMALLMTAALLLGIMPPLTLSAAAAGDVLTVTNLSDSSAGSLRDAIDSATSGDTIVFQSGLTGTIELTSQLTIGKSLTITGPGASSLTVSGNNACRVFVVTGGNVNITGLTIANGKAVGTSGGNGDDGYGGGGGGGGGAAGGGGGLLYKGSDTLVLSGVNFVNNSAVGGNGGSGGEGYQAGDGGAKGGDGGVSDLYTSTTAGIGNDESNESRYIDATNYSGGGGGWGANNETKTSLTLGGAGACGDPTAFDYTNPTSNTTGNSSSASNGTRGGNGGTGGSCYWGNGKYAYGGNGGNGGDGYGGAICMTTPGNLLISGCSFTGNGASGGHGGTGGMSNNANHGFGGYGGSGKGGAIYVGSYVASQTNILLVNSTFSGNSVTAGTGGLGYTTGYYGADGGTLSSNICSYGRNSISVRNISGVTSYDGTSNVMLYPANNASTANGDSKLDASVYETTADGVSAITLTVLLCDSSRMPVVGEMVTINQGSGHSTISPVSAFTDLNGKAVFTVTNSVAETVTYQAVTSGGVTITAPAPVNFKVGGVSAAKSTVVANPTVVTADGSASSTITVSLKDATGNAIGSNRTIKLTAGGGSSIITPTSAITDSSGTVTFTVKNSTAEQVTYTAKDTTDGVTLTQTATVNFTQYNWIVSSLDDADTTGTLRYAIEHAPDNTTITFDGSLSGEMTKTINLSSPLPAINKNLIIDGGSLNLTISGGNLCRVFEVNGGNVTIQNLSIAGGRSAGAAGAAGTYNASNGLGGSGQSGAGGSGGAMLITGGTVTVSGVSFSGNSAVGGSGGRGADSTGSGLSYSGWAGIGGAGGNGLGGAVCVTGGSLAVSNSAFTSNGASGGSGGNGGDGKDLDGAGGNGGSGLGGAIYASAGAVTITNTTFSGNSTSGGGGGSCGSGTSAASGYFGSSGKSGNGGNSNGGGIYINNCALAITDSQFAGGNLSAGAKGTGIHGDGSGGTAYGTDICSIGGTVTSSDVTLTPGANSFYNSLASDAAASTVTAAPASVISDNTAVSTVTVTLKGSGGSAIGSGKTVTLNQGSGHSTITPSSAVTDNNGTATFAVKNSRAETVTYTAVNETDGITVTQTAAVEFLPPDDSPSAIDAGSTSISANNTETTTITVTLKYSNGDPAIGKTVSLDQGTGHSSISPASAVTDSSGQAVFTVKSAVAETVAYKAKITPDNVTMAESASVTFNAYGWVVSTKVDTGDTGSLRYAILNAPDGETITFAGNLAGETLTLASALPAINKNLTIDGLNLGVKISGDGQYRVFEIAGGTVNLKNLTIANGYTAGAAGANGTWSDGSGGAKGSGGGLYITNGAVNLNGVTFKDNKVIGGNGGNGAVDSIGNGGAGGNGYGGAIYLSTGSLSVENCIFIGNRAAGGNGGDGGNGYSGGNGGNGGNGCGGAIYVGAGTVTLSNSTFSGNAVDYGSGGGHSVWERHSGSIGSVVGCDIYNPGGTVTIGDNVTLDPGTNSYINHCYAPDGALSTVTADDTSVMSGSGVYATITVTLIGPGGSSIGAGKSVTLTPNGGNSSVSPATAVTDGYGRATFTVTDPYVQNVTYTAKDTSDNVTITQTVAISFMAPDAAKSTIAVDAAQVSSDNVTYATVTVALKGADGSPAGGGKAVTLTADGGSSQIAPVNNGQTDGSGIATFQVKNLKSESVTYTATDTTDGVTVSDKISVEFLAPDKDASSAVTGIPSVKADGTTAATISITLKNAAGVPFASGKAVTLTAENGNSNITAKDNGFTDDSGTATFYVSNLAIESVTYTAKDTTDNVTLEATVTVDFIQNDWIVTKLDDTDTLGSLRYAIKNAPTGTTIGFDGSLTNGTIVLSSPLPVITKNLMVDGGGTAITISGGDAYRVFEVSGGTLILSNLTIAHGKNIGAAGREYNYGYYGNGGAGAIGAGGGLYITGGVVAIDHVTFRDNMAVGGRGGSSSSIDYRNGGIGGNGYGGAIYLYAGTLTITNSIFNGNCAIGGTGGYSLFSSGASGGSGYGGALYVNAGSLAMSDIQFSGNSTTGGVGGATGSYWLSQGSTGGAYANDLYNVNGTIALSSVTFGALTNSYCSMLPASDSTSTVSGSVSGLPAGSDLRLPADSVTTLTVTVTLRDAEGKSAGSGKYVTLTAGGGSTAINSASNGLTDNNGLVTFTVTGSSTANVTFTAKDETDNVTIGQVSAAFQPPDAGISTIVTDATSVTANAAAEATITVTLKYSSDIPAAGKTVALTAVTGNAKIQAVNNIAVTDQNGVVTFTVTDSYAETVTFKATNTTDNVELDGSVDISFTEYSWVVSSLADTNDLGTLRYAVANAPAGATIHFVSGLSDTLTLTSQLPTISRSLTIDGTGAAVTVSGDQQYRIFEVSGGTVSLKNLSVINGAVKGSQGIYGWNNPASNGGTGTGGALLVTGGSVTVEQVTFNDNQAVGGDAYGNSDGYGGAGYGGAVCLQAGSLTVSNCSFAGNSAGGGSPTIYRQGAEAYGGAIYLASGSLTVSNCSFTGNSAKGSACGSSHNTGGGAYGGAISINAGSLTLSNNQFSGNSANRGGGTANSSQLGFDLYNLSGIFSVDHDTFSSGGASSVYNALPVSVSKSSVTADKTAVPADGAAIVTVTVVLKDSNGSPAGSGKKVTLTADIDGVEITPADGAVTDAFGRATFTVTSTAANIITFTASDATIQLAVQVQFDPYFTVTFDKQDGTPVTSTNLAAGAKILLPAVPVRSNYTFDGWFTDAGNAWDFDTGTVAASMTLYAKWTGKDCAVAYDSRGGSPVASITAEYDTTISAPTEPTRTGYTFAGWYKEAVYTNEWNFTSDVVTGDITMYAKWTINSYDVNFESRGGSPVASITAEYNKAISTPSEPTRTGYTFAGWYKEAVYTNEWNFTSDVVTGDITMYAKWTINSYDVNFESGDGSPVASITAEYNTAISAPTEPTRTGYTFDGWYKEAAYTNKWNFTSDVVQGDTTLYAKWNAIGGSGGSGNDPSGDSSSEITVHTTGGITTATATVPGSLGTNGTAAASLTQDQVTTTVSGVLIEAAKQGTKAEVEISVDTKGGATGVSVTIPQAALDAITDGGIDALTISSAAVTVTFDAAALEKISLSGSGSITISAVTADDAMVTEEFRRAVGDRPVYDLTVTSGNTTISGFGGGTATVSIPYTPAAGEDTSKIVIYYISDNGALITVPYCTYDHATGMVTFTTTHFSSYAVGYNDVRFTDASGWYEDSVGFVAARGMMSGTGSGLFCPNGTMTRAMFVTVLYRMSGDDSSYANSFADVPAGIWYENAVAWAAANSIVSGVGNNSFAPDSSITREQLAIMLHNYSEYLGYDVSVGEETYVMSYKDTLTISDYAHPAMQWACAAGILTGDDTSNLNPHEIATRAEAAAMLQRFIEKGSSGA